MDVYWEFVLAKIKAIFLGRKTNIQKKPAVSSIFKFIFVKLYLVPRSTVIIALAKLYGYPIFISPFHTYIYEKIYPVS
ncbi:MAG TPA: hypothetical protein DCX41_02780 [Aequorivita sp.]|nr:hypothetical protein [Aequorivita sp.]|tara:strand:+ start:11787 stop:12020 length:234 start_codon:yes stop_codon:yes gene_type:complete